LSLKAQLFDQGGDSVDGAGRAFRGAAAALQLLEVNAGRREQCDCIGEASAKFDQRTRNKTLAAAGRGIMLQF
jgi:hypothetical protein